MVWVVVALFITQLFLVYTLFSLHKTRKQLDELSRHTVAAYDFIDVLDKRSASLRDDVDDVLLLISPETTTSSDTLYKFFGGE